MGVHVVLLLAVALGVPLLSLRFWARPSPGRIAAAIGLGVLAAAASLAFGLHLCDRGIPLHQWAIPCVAMPFAACIGPDRLRRLVLGALALVAFGLSLDFAGRVHELDVVGDPAAHCTAAEPLWHTPLTGFYAARPTC